MDEGAIVIRKAAGIEPKQVIYLQKQSRHHEQANERNTLAGSVHSA
jgi:hypothetical protein